MSESASILPTVGEIARKQGVPLHRVEYLIRARGMTPSGWAGNARVFSEADVALIAEELQRGVVRGGTRKPEEGSQ